MRFTRSIVPNMFTLVNLYMGFSAIVHTTYGHYEKAALFILVAGIFDMIDGIVARLLRATSKFGVELDSLCDLVSFGVAPSYILYHVYFHQFGEMGILLSSFPALAGATRLARFNIQLTSLEDKLFFTGLPIPASAFFIVSYVVFFHLSNTFSQNISDILIFSVTLGASMLMVSRIKFYNVPRPTSKSIKENPVIFVIFAIGLIASILSRGKFVFPFMLFYIIGSIIRQLIIKYTDARKNI